MRAKTGWCLAGAMALPGKCTQRPTASRTLAEEIPAVALQVEKHRNLAIRFGAGRSHELHPGGHQASVRRVEIVHAKKQSNATSKLATYDGRLLRSVGARQQN